MDITDINDLLQYLGEATNGTFSYDDSGNLIYTDPSGKSNYASTSGLENLTTESMMQTVPATLQYELANIASQTAQLPSSTKAAISGNESTTAQNNLLTELIPYLKDTQISTNQLTTGKNNAELQTLDDWLANKESEYQYSTNRNNMLNGMVDLEGDSIASGYNTQIANDKLAQIKAQMGIELTPAEQDYILSQYNLGKATNESNQRLIPSSEEAALQTNLYNADTASMNTRLNKGLESATSAEYMLKKAQADSGVRTTPFQEAATISGYNLDTAQNKSNQSLIPDSEAAARSKYNYDTAYNQGQTSLLPQRFEATGKFIDESMKGKSVKGAMDTASADVSMAYKGANDATRRNLARAGLSANASSFANDGLEMAKANVAARTNARKTTEDQNYSRLGAVALMP